LNIVWSPQALEDVEAALEYLVPRNAPAAAKLAAGILALVEQLADASLEGPEHVLRTGERVRGWPYPPFRIYYQRTMDGLLVVRVFHQRRAPIARP
jgi:plasmid stabilization system protein ParE